MNIVYSNKAKDDLARIDWRIRTKIINELGAISELRYSRRTPLKKLHGSDLVKTTLEKHVIVGEANGKLLNILSVFRQQKLKPSGVKFVQAD
jgi:hypothetical protein